MASKLEDLFHEAIKFSLEKLGKPNLELQREQFEAIRAACVERKDVLAVLPTSFGKFLIYQILPAIFDFLRSRRDKQEENSVVIVVSPLNSLMKGQLKKIRRIFKSLCCAKCERRGRRELSKFASRCEEMQVPLNVAWWKNWGFQIQTLLKVT